VSITNIRKDKLQKMIEENEKMFEELKNLEGSIRNVDLPNPLHMNVTDITGILLVNIQETRTLIELVKKKLEFLKEYI
jgi:hypothetical protein